MRKAMEEKDEQSCQELEKERNTMQEKIERLQKDSAEMKVNMTDLQKELDSIWMCVLM